MQNHILQRAQDHASYGAFSPQKIYEGDNFHRQLGQVQQPNVNTILIMLQIIHYFQGSYLINLHIYIQ